MVDLKIMLDCVIVNISEIEVDNNLPLLTIQYSTSGTRETRVR